MRLTPTPGAALCCAYCGKVGRSGFILALAAGDELVTICADRAKCRRRKDRGWSTAA